MKWDPYPKKLEMAGERLPHLKTKRRRWQRRWTRAGLSDEPRPPERSSCSVSQRAPKGTPRTSPSPSRRSARGVARRRHPRRKGHEIRRDTPVVALLELRGRALQRALRFGLENEAAEEVLALPVAVLDGAVGVRRTVQTADSALVRRAANERWNVSAHGR